MVNKIVINLKYWILAIVLASSTFFSYFRYIQKDQQDLSSKLMAICYLLLFLLAIVFFNKLQTLNYKKIWHSLFILGIPLLNLIFYFQFGLPKYKFMFLENISELQIILVTLIGILIVQSKVINSVLNRFYFIAFLFAFYYTLMHFFGKMERNQYLNENTWGFILAPFLIYLFVINKKIVIRLMVFIAGSILIYLSGANTTLMAFILLPIFMFISNRVKRPRMIYLIFLFLGLGLVFVASNLINNEIVIKILTFRNMLWDVYLNNVSSSFSTLIGGTGTWKTPLTNDLPIWHLRGAGSHNTFVGLLHYNGIIVLMLYLAFIIFGVRRKSNKFTVSDGVLFLALTFQFAETNMPLFSYIFPSIIFLLNILINKESEEAELEMKELKEATRNA